MQPTRRATRVPFGFNHLQLIALSLAAGLLALSVAGYVVRHDATTHASRSNAAANLSVVTNARAGNYRFMEANLVLPGVSVKAPQMARWLEINQLPGAVAAAPATAPSGTTTMASSATSHLRFMEINQLPGDGIHQQTSSGFTGNRR